MQSAQPYPAPYLEKMPKMKGKFQILLTIAKKSVRIEVVSCGYCRDLVVLSSGRKIRMFEKGDFIIYETAGTCKVTDIRTVDIDGISKERLYYVLEPLGDRGSKIMTPVDSTKSFMRKILTKDDVYRLIDEMKNIDQLGILDEKQRKETYKAALKSCDCRAWIGIIKNLYLKKQDRTLQGKRLTEADEQFFSKAKEYLYGEMSISLGIPKEQVEEFITNRIDAEEMQPT